MQVALINHTPDPVITMSRAAAVCYDSEPSTKIVEHCLKSGHESITEFATFHFEIVGISRACSHQLVRHRLASYAQRSQRYCKEGATQFVYPPSIRANSTAVQCYNAALVEVLVTYRHLLDLGIPPEDARYILPNATQTALHVSMNFRELRHFCEQRLCSRAQWEIQEVALRMKMEVEKVSPFLAKYLVPKCERLGYCPEVKSCGRTVRKETLDASSV